MSFKPQAAMPQAHAEMMAALWSEELSASQVAYRVNLAFGTVYTRSAVLGKVRRLKLPLRATGRKRIKAPVVVAEPKVVAVLPPPPPPPEPPPAPLNIPLADAQRAQCRWMVDDRAICGVTTKRGPWCEHHRRIVYTKHKADAA